MKHRRSRRWAPAVLGATAVAAALAAILVAGPSTAAVPPAIGRLQTPVLSLRRVPGLVAQTVGTLRLDQALDTALADPRIGATRQNTCLLVERAGRVIYSRRPTQPLIPASNLKLLTMTAVLDRLGPAARLTATSTWSVAGTRCSARPTSWPPCGTERWCTTRSRPSPNRSGPPASAT